MAEKIIIIVLTVFAALAILYLLFGLVCFIFIRVFTRKIKKNSKAVNLLLVQRQDIMKEIVEIAKSNDILLPSDDVENIALLNHISDFQTLAKEDRDQRILSFMHSSRNLITLCSRNSLIKDSKEFLNALSKYKDIEESYRQISALYNSDVIGFNYWINVIFIRPFMKISKVKNKDLIV